MKRIIAILMLLTLTAVTLTACATKLPTQQHFSSPPTEAEIAEFRRTHPVEASDENAYSIPIDTPIENPWLGGRDTILSVKIIGEREDDVIIVAGTTKVEQHYYLSMITEVIALDFDSKLYQPYAEGDIVYIDVRLSSPHIDEEYIIIAFNCGREVDGNLIKTNRNKIPDLLVNVNAMFYITNNDYIISASTYEASNKYTGEPVETVIEKLQVYAKLPVRDAIDEYFDEQARIADQGSIPNKPIVDGSVAENAESLQ
jgi:hypothetical protein